MTDIENMTPGQVLADASVAEFIKTLGLSIAEAQKALDENSVAQMGEFLTPRDSLGGKTLLDMGLMPAFYHYQHADISCSLQLSLRVEKDLSVGVNLNGSFSDTTTSGSTTSSGSSSTESGSSTTTQTRAADIRIANSSRGALTVGGQNFQLTGTSARARIDALSDQIRGQQDVTRAIPVETCTPIVPTPTTNAPAGKVICSGNDVAFVGGGFDQGIIRIRTNPSADEIYKMNAATSVTVSRSTAVPAYAIKVKDAIDATAFTATHIPPGRPLTEAFFDVDKSFIRPAHDSSLLKLAQFIKASSIPVIVKGYASRTASESHNDALSTRRAEAVKARLIANGAPANLITTAALGETEWAAMGVPDNSEFQRHRVVRVVADSPDHFIWVDGDAANRLAAVLPDQLNGANTGNGNGWVHLYEAVGLTDVNGKTVTIKGQTFPLSGAAAGGHGQDSAEAFALNLATAVNANAAAQVDASANGNVTHLCNQGDSYQLILVTESSRSILLSGTDGVTITTQFSRTATNSATQQNSGNRTVAVGASVDVRFGRQFEMNVTGNSAISARLVSIPAPPQFLATIKEFLATNGG